MHTKRFATGRAPFVVRRSALLVLLLSFVLLYPSFSAPAAAQGERLVLAFYYAWFGMDVWNLPLSDQPLYPYQSTDPAAIERHVQEAQQASIDAFVQSWYGPQVENNQTETNFRQLLDISARYGFRAAVDLEVTSPFLRSSAHVVDTLNYLLAVHTQHPAYLRVGGKPVIFFWRQGQYSADTWTGIRDQVDPSRTSVWIAEGTDLSYVGPFDGLHLYSVAWSDDPAGVLTQWGARVREWSATQGASKTWVATVMPGYDDLNTGRSGAFVRPRAGGEYYRQCWDGAIRSHADWVVITSYNEWREGTMIETSAGYGDYYLNLTAELAAAYRQGALGAPAIAAQSTPPPTELPEPTVEPPPTLPPPTETLTPTATATTWPTAARTPPHTPSPTRTPTATAVLPTPRPPTPVPTSTLAERAAAWPQGRWLLGAAVALLAIGAVVQALRLRREVVGGRQIDNRS